MSAADTPGFFTAAECSVADFARSCEVATPPGTYPYATEVVREVVIYDAASLRPTIAEPGGCRQLMKEMAAVLRHGTGVFVIRGAVDAAVVERATVAFQRLIADQHAAGTAAGDHFAAPGSNDRVWNALEKLAVADPEAFVDYYSNDMLALAAAAWLGPGYQITSQVNVVNPGGTAQAPHRDYHLGFMSDAHAESFPVHAHLLSAALTLQGAIAHSDMSVASGPTKLLPHSQKYPAGYIAWRRPEFVEYFEQHQVQLPLAAGDAVFFNPALFHAAGSNLTPDVRRMANLLQVSSAMGRAMESVDHTRVANAIYPALLARANDGWSTDRINAVIAASAEAYAFPTNLDRDPPLSGLAPATEADTMRTAVAQRWTAQTLASALHGHAERRRTS